jgi:hypothetical protein
MREANAHASMPLSVREHKKWDAVLIIRLPACHKVLILLGFLMFSYVRQVKGLCFMR